MGHMTYRQLLRRLQTMTQEELDNNVSIKVDDEYRELLKIEFEKRNRCS